MVPSRLLTSLTVLLLCFSFSSSTGSEQKNVLMLLDTWGPIVEEGRHTIEASISRGRDDVEFYTEVLDASRFSGPEHEAMLAAFLRDKYAELTIDLALVVGPQSLAFLTRHRAALFTKVPIVFVGVRESTLPRDRPPNTTGVTSHLDVVKTLELALALQPDARQVIVVSGTGPTDIGWNAVARDTLGSYRDRLDITYLSGAPLSSLLRELAQLPRTAIVIFTSMGRDGAGQSFTVTDLAAIIAASSAAVYGVYEMYVGNGIVGGYMDSVAAMGNAAANLTLRVLAGESADSLPIQYEGSAVFLVDWRQLRRWELDESRLPPGAIVRFREPSLWARYRVEILGAIALVILQALGIVLLLLRARKRRVEVTLRETEDRYRNVVEAESDLICRYLPDTRLTFVNDAYCRYFGRTREELVGKSFTALIPESERAAWVDHVRSLLTHPRSEAHTQQVMRPDGSTGWQQWIERVIVDAQGTAVEIQAICRDITELKLAEVEAQQRRDQVTHLARVAILGELSGALAHELNQPLTAILSNAQAGERLLEREAVDLAEIRDILGDIVSDDVRAGEVISRLRALMKTGSVDFEPIDLNDLTSEVLRLARGLLVEHRVAVTVRLAPALPEARGDRVQLQQVMLNLLLNACEAMFSNEPADRALAVSTAYDERGLVVSVVDNGSGLAPQAADRVFESFFTTKDAGLGLGLSICRSIITAHGGRLSASNNVGRGATFTFALPAVAID